MDSQLFSSPYCVSIYWFQTLAFYVLNSRTYFSESTYFTIDASSVSLYIQDAADNSFAAEDCAEVC